MSHFLFLHEWNTKPVGRTALELLEGTFDKAKLAASSVFAKLGKTSPSHLAFEHTKTNNQ